MLIDIFLRLADYPGMLTTGLAVPERKGVDQDLNLYPQLIDGFYVCQNRFNGIQLRDN